MIEHQMLYDGAEDGQKNLEEVRARGSRDEGGVENLTMRTARYLKMLVGRAALARFSSGRGEDSVSGRL